MSAFARSILVSFAWLGCGPSVEDADSTAGTGTGGGTTAPPPTSSSSTTVGSPSTTGETSTTSVGGPTSSPNDSSGSSVTDTRGPGGDCEPAEPAPEPPLPQGCEHAWLVDENSNPIEGAYSGIVRCGSGRPSDQIAYRTAAVACPELVGDECSCDADCESGSACICANEAIDRSVGQAAANRCIPVDCTGADDCRGGLCRMDLGVCVGTYYPEAFRCTTEGDDCVFPSDCPPRYGVLCDYDEVNEMFTCTPGAICE